MSSYDKMQYNKNPMEWGGHSMDKNASSPSSYMSHLSSGSSYEPNFHGRSVLAPFPKAVNYYPETQPLSYVNYPQTSSQESSMNLLPEVENYHQQLSHMPGYSYPEAAPSSPSTHSTPSSLNWGNIPYNLNFYESHCISGKEPYLLLKAGVIPSSARPMQVYFDKQIILEKGQHHCMFPGGCSAKVTVFRRPADLERHYQNFHGDNGASTFACDYPKCPRVREPFRRKDHYRDHLRDFHLDDVAPPSEATALRKGQNLKQMLETWSSGRRWQKNTWRCSKCLSNNDVAGVGWSCWSCKAECEPVRIRLREAKFGKRVQDNAFPGAFSDNVARGCSMCGYTGYVNNEPDLIECFCQKAGNSHHILPMPRVGMANTDFDPGYWSKLTQDMEDIDESSSVLP